MNTDDVLNELAIDAHFRRLDLGAREIHCSHRKHGICSTPTGKIKVACQAEAERGSMDSERFHATGDFAYMVRAHQAMTIMRDPELRAISDQRSAIMCGVA